MSGAAITTGSSLCSSDPLRGSAADSCGAIYTLSAQGSAANSSTIAWNYLHEAPVLGCFGELPQCSNNQGIYRASQPSLIL